MVNVATICAVVSGKRAKHQRAVYSIEFVHTIRQDREIRLQAEYSRVWGCRWAFGSSEAYWLRERPKGYSRFARRRRFAPGLHTRLRARCNWWKQSDTHWASENPVVQSCMRRRSCRHPYPQTRNNWESVPSVHLLFFRCNPPRRGQPGPMSRSLHWSLCTEFGLYGVTIVGVDIDKRIFKLGRRECNVQRLLIHFDAVVGCERHPADEIVSRRDGFTGAPLESACAGLSISYTCL